MRPARIATFSARSTRAHASPFPTRRPRRSRGRSPRGCRARSCTLTFARGRSEFGKTAENLRSFAMVNLWSGFGFGDHDDSWPWFETRGSAALLTKRISESNDLILRMVRDQHVVMPGRV